MHRLLSQKNCSLSSRLLLNVNDGVLLSSSMQNSNMVRSCAIALCPQTSCKFESFDSDKSAVLKCNGTDKFKSVFRNLSMSSRVSQNLKSDPKIQAQKDPTTDKIDNTVDTAAAVGSETKSNQKEKLKKAFREYGATVVVFHTCISLFTLGVSYTAVSSGLDVVGLMAKLGVGQSILESKLATGASTFVVAYAVHKVFAPARMACTITVTPFIVRYLRKIGFLKKTVSK